MRHVRDVPPVHAVGADGLRSATPYQNGTYGTTGQIHLIAVSGGGVGPVSAASRKNLEEFTTKA
jgi:hypothetical protein